MPSSPTDAVTLLLEDGTELKALAALAADGRGSRLREAVGINVRTWSYPQTALVLNFSHSIAHADTSTEFHTEQGPFTQVPLPGKRSSLVWAVRPEEVDSILALPRMALNREVETRMRSILGAVEVEGKVQAWRCRALSRTVSARAGPCLSEKRAMPSRRSETRVSILACATSCRPSARSGMQEDRRTLRKPSAPSTVNAARCHQPDSRGRPAQPCAVEFVFAGPGTSRWRSGRIVRHSAAAVVSHARRHDARLAPQWPDEVRRPAPVASLSEIPAGS
jgi:hypothetical protein